MQAPARLVDWLSNYEFADRKGLLPAGLKVQYHPRSDEHSKALAQYIMDDLIELCEPLRAQAARGQVAYGINHRFRWKNGKEKALDLVVGLPQNRLPPPPDGRIQRLTGRPPLGGFSRLFIACEEKATMTEHGKSQPRVYSELNDAHTIVHQGSRDTISAGILMLNIADRFIAPLRQARNRPLTWSTHNQPTVTERMVDHLRKLPLREGINEIGFEAFSTFVIDADNQGHVALHEGPPAPQRGDIDHYQTFLERIFCFYSERFSALGSLPDQEGLTIEGALRELSVEYPGLLWRAGALVVSEGLGGAKKFRAVMETIEHYADDSGM